MTEEPKTMMKMMMEVMETMVTASTSSRPTKMALVFWMLKFPRRNW
jgi:hypothetical protein